jgi:hypothetical protein
MHSTYCTQLASLPAVSLGAGRPGMAMDARAFLCSVGALLHSDAVAAAPPAAPPAASSVRTSRPSRPQPRTRALAGAPERRRVCRRARKSRTREQGRARTALLPRRRPQRRTASPVRKAAAASGRSRRCGLAEPRAARSSPCAHSLLLVRATLTNTAAPARRAPPRRMSQPGLKSGWSRTACQPRARESVSLPIRRNWSTNSRVHVTRMTSCVLP